MKACSSLKILGCLCASVILWAEGSGATQSTNALVTKSTASGHLSSTRSADSTGTQSRMRHSRRSVMGWVKRVDFLDTQGRTTKTFEEGKDRILKIQLPDIGPHVGVIRKVGPVRSPVMRKFSLHDDVGEERWSADLCCDAGHSGDVVIFSPDGEFVALLDAGKGRGCVDGYSFYSAPDSCAALRIFKVRGNGSPIFQLDEGIVDNVRFSSRGRFVLFRWNVLDSSEEWHIVETRTGHWESFQEEDVHGSPMRPSDDGVSKMWRPAPPFYDYCFGHGFTLSKTIVGPQIP